MLYDDIKYLRFLPLEGYKEKNNPPYFANFRCPICGDSEHNKHKARGWAFIDNENVIMHCFNCSFHSSFYDFLKNYYPEYYMDYVKEKMLERNSGSIELEMFKQEKVLIDIAEFDIPRLSKLPKDHAAVKYVMRRKIPEKYLPDLYYTDNFPKFCEQYGIYVNEIAPERIVIPFRDNENKLFMFQGRHIFPNSKAIKYISVKLDSEADKIYGLDKVDFTKDVFVTEGPIDSMFLPNSVALAGGVSSLSLLEKYAAKEKYILIFDNERRNNVTFKLMKTAIERGWRIFLWPENISQKDINDLVIDGYDIKMLTELINDNIIQGITGKIKLKLWK